jgi:hypothetical protein
MKRLFRPMLLLLAAFVLLVAGLLFSQQFPKGYSPPQPLALAPNEHEVVWLSPATSVSGWERFVAAVRRSTHRMKADMPDLEGQFDLAYPPRSTDVPEVALTWKNSSQRLVFRWYKVTSFWKSADWVQALLTHRRPPLAIIGGSNSESAWTLAQELKEAARKHSPTLPASQLPALLLTTATADRVSPSDAFGGQIPDEQRIRLTEIYHERTFRFCFTNRQMAFAVTRFISSQPDLRTDNGPVYFVQWDDDSYSYDLNQSLMHALIVESAQQSAMEWAWVTGCVQAGNPPGLLAGCAPPSRFRWTNPYLSHVFSSVGSFQQPNRHEADSADDLSKELLRHPEQRRPLLLVTGQAQPCRRFLKALYQLNPERTRRLVVGTGDALSFNNIYRDRRTFWPIQDLPMSLVFFCHCNPIDTHAGFQPSPEGFLKPAEPAGDPGASRADAGDELPSSTGTEDILLNADIVETAARAFAHDGQPCQDTDELISRLRRVRVDDVGIHLDGDGEPFFAPSGNRRSATGEHVVWLQPSIKDGRVLPEARLEVWRWQPSGRGSVRPGSEAVMGWKLCDALLANYDPLTGEGAHR